MQEKELIENIVDYFTKNIFNKHINTSLKTHTKLKNYNINPIIVKYLSKVLVNDFTPDGIAKALFYPRVLGTSINTSFGTQIQNMFIDLEMAKGSLIKGMDIEFIDKTDSRQKWCQLKSGPNTINSEDVKPLIKNFSDTINLARTNRAVKNINNTDFIVGVIYGDNSELSMHYKEIDKIHPVFVGKEFWERITGYPNFYDLMVKELHSCILNLDTQDFLTRGCEELANEIANSSIFNFKQ